MKTVGQAKLDDDLIRYLEAEGFVWSTERGCYFMPHEKFQKWNNKPVSHLPMSFATDAFQRAVRRV